MEGREILVDAVHIRRGKLGAAVRAMMVLAGLVLAACSGPVRLSDKEQAKLDPTLTKLLQGEPVDESKFDTALRPDGSKEYSVIIRGDRADALRAAGISVGSVFDDVVTARVTVTELRKILRLESVRYIQTGSKITIQ